MNKKIFFVGEYKHHFYEPVVSQELKKMGCQVMDFIISDNKHSSILAKTEKYLKLKGPYLRKINNELFEACLDFKPDIIFLWRPVYIFPETIKKLKTNLSDAIVITYNNDDPFSEKYNSGSFFQKRLWRFFKPLIKLSDQNYVYRPQNITDYLNYGAEHAELFMPYFIANVVEAAEPFDEKFDVLFIGHFEDHRWDAIKWLIDNGVKIKVFGGESWRNSETSTYEDKGIEFKSLIGNDYFSAIKSAKICLAFLSKLNRDVYTRRCFEIPACGTTMVCERTEALQNLFQENQEAVYFSSKEELLEQVKWLLTNLQDCENIGNAGKLRSYKSGYEVGGRVANLLRQINLSEKGQNV